METAKPESNKEFERKQQAMIKKIKGLGMTNPIVKGVVDAKKNQEDSSKKNDQWGPVRKLSSEAFDQFNEGDLSFDRALVSLASALFKLAGETAEKNNPHNPHNPHNPNGFRGVSERRASEMGLRRRRKKKRVLIGQPIGQPVGFRQPLK